MVRGVGVQERARGRLRVKKEMFVLLTEMGMVGVKWI